MHQQAQTQACTHVQYKQHTHKNANKHEHSRNHMHAHKEGADDHTWVAQDVQGWYGTGGRRNWVCRGTGGHRGQYSDTHGHGEQQTAKKQHNKQGPEDTKTSSTAQKKICNIGLMHQQTQDAETTPPNTKKPQQHAPNNTARNMPAKQQNQQTS